MTTRVEARTEIVQLFQTNLVANFPGVPFFWDDTTAVDLDQVGDLFVRVAITFQESEELTIDPGREMRRNATASVFVFQKEGSPQTPALQIFDTLENVVRFVASTKVRLQSPVQRGPESRQGWTSRGVDVPFYFDTLDWAN